MSKFNFHAALLIAGVALAAPLGAGFAYAEMTKTVGGAPMYPSKNIVQNAVNSKDHTTLVAAVKAAGLVDTLQGKGPFTVFAPTNAAFGMLPPGTVENLLRPEEKVTLTKVLTYHVVAGRYTSTKLREMIQEGHGQATLKTVEGGTLTLMMNGSNNILIKDGKGDVADIVVYDVVQSNGEIFSIDHVLMPSS
jgi:uncharacterized surface protein with fasciclin (FAS1) repeats